MAFAHSRAPELGSRLYASVHDGTPGDLKFYRDVCSGAASILELGCGAGRVLAALQDHARRLVGVDLDASLLALAADRVGPHVELVRADMRTFELQERFDRIIVPHSGLFCLLDDEALDACLARARRHLAPEGLLAFDVYDADGLQEQDPLEALDPEALVFVKRIEVDLRRWDVFERSTWDAKTQRIDATYVHIPEDGGPPIEHVIRQRYLLTDQLVAALARAGFEPTELRSRFDASQDEVIVIVARGAREPGA